ncbi:MAG: FmdE family protein [Desulfomonilia bacterium]
MNVGPYTFSEFMDKVKEFHGSPAPGVIAGGIMVEIAKKNLPEGEFFDVICETPKCLPDAVQLLTPCTIGNGWLKIVNTSRYALTFYNKHSGEGVRVSLDVGKLGDTGAIRAWYLKEKPKDRQDLSQILKELEEAGTRIYRIEAVMVRPEYRATSEKTHSRIVLCPSCGEGYRVELGEQCPSCQGLGPYLSTGD